MNQKELSVLQLVNILIFLFFCNGFAVSDSVESLNLPFSLGRNNPVHSKFGYRGGVTIKVTGTGQCAGTQYNDAFYIFSDENHVPCEPPQKYESMLLINDVCAIPESSAYYPSYNDTHVYEFGHLISNAGLLYFSIGDIITGDNTGGYTITIFADSTVQYDIDACWIERLPHFDFDTGATDPRIDGWPSSGQSVIWRAHVKSTISIKDVMYEWLIDGILVGSGKIDSLSENVPHAIDYGTSWQQARQTLEFKLDQNDSFPQEVSELNNNISTVTNALSLAIAVEQSVYDTFNIKQRFLNDGANSFEDWAQRNVRIINDMLETSGAIDRIRIDTIAVMPNNHISDQNCPIPDNRSVDLQRGLPLSNGELTNSFNNFDCRYDNPNYFFGGFWHELFHVRWLPDLYAIDTWEPRDIIDIIENGSRIFGTHFLPDRFRTRFKDIMLAHNDTNYNHQLSQYSSLYLNHRAGYRATRGNCHQVPDMDNVIGTMINMLPSVNIITIKDSAGSTVNRAEVKVFQCESIPNNESAYRKLFDSIPELTDTTDMNGRIYYGKCPFDKDGRLEPGRDLSNGVVILRIAHNSNVMYTFFESTLFNIEYWKGNQDTAYYDLIVNFPFADIKKPACNSGSRTTPLILRGNMIIAASGNTDYEPTNITVYTLSGKRVHVGFPTDDKIVCNLNKLSPGVYFIRYLHGKNVAQVRFVKEY